jgi:hypothetical protein
VIVTCPKCFSFDDVLPPRRSPDGRIDYTCTGDHGGEGPFRWSSTPDAVDLPSPRRTAASSSSSATRAPRAPRAPRPNPDDASIDELLDPLLACVNPGEPFVEYGVVEYRFRQARPDLFLQHVRERGHVMLGTRRNLAASSSRFTRALRKLESAGQLVSVKGPGTGAWRYEQSIGYWARPPRPSGPLLTWSMFCATQGRSAEWTAEDRALFDTP